MVHGGSENPRMYVVHYFDGRVKVLASKDSVPQMVKSARVIGRGPRRSWLSVDSRGIENS